MLPGATLNRDVDPARAAHLDALQVHHRLRLVGRDDRVVDQIRSQRPARASGRRIFDDAELRREHPRVGRRRITGIGAIGREDVRLEVHEACIRHGAIDRRAGGERHEDVGYAARHLLHRQPRRSNIVFRQTQGGRDPPQVVDDRTEHGSLLRHPGEIKAGAVPFHRHRRRTDVQPERPLRASCRNRTIPGEREGAPDDRMAGHWKLVSGGEDPHADVGVGTFRPRHERRFGKADFARDLLHDERRQPGGAGNTASWFPPKRRPEKTS